MELNAKLDAYLQDPKDGLDLSGMNFGAGGCEKYRCIPSTVVSQTSGFWVSEVLHQNLEIWGGRRSRDFVVK
jgi:hypothetical protein